MKNLLVNITSTVVIILLIQSANEHRAAAQTIRIDATAPATSTHADAVGIWVNTIDLKHPEAMLSTLRSLRFNSLRYGWQFGWTDPSDLSSQRQTPRDDAVSGYLSDGAGRIRETIGPSAIGHWLQDLQVSGHGILTTDGVRYVGKQDASLAAMSPKRRREVYSELARRFARWGTNQGFSHFEIGNENDLSGHGDTGAVIEPWTPQSYALVARSFHDALAAAEPSAKCGINGGLLDDEKTLEWFRGIAKTDPQLAADLDFLIYHKYEMWLDRETWVSHPDWAFGRVSDGYLTARNRYFPDLPIHITELGPWKINPPSDNQLHYRAVLGLEMLGNAFSEPAVHQVHVWPTRWSTEGGVVSDDDITLTGMGLGIAAYTRHMQPIQFANGAQGAIRYFASRNQDASQLTIWLINHAEHPSDVTLSINFPSASSNLISKRWLLSSPDPSPTSTITQLVPLQNGPAGKSMKWTLPPISAGILTLQGQKPE